MKTYDRIIELCKDKGESVHSLEVKCGLSNGQISKLKTGTTSAEKMLAIAQQLEVSVEYLLTGQIHDNSFHLSNLEKNIICSFRNADEYDQIAVLRILKIDKESRKNFLKLIKGGN